MQRSLVRSKRRGCCCNFVGVCTTPHQEGSNARQPARGSNTQRRPPIHDGKPLLHNGPTLDLGLRNRLFKKTTMTHGQRSPYVLIFKCGEYAYVVCDEPVTHGRTYTHVQARTHGHTDAHTNGYTRTRRRTHAQMHAHIAAHHCASSVHLTYSIVCPQPEIVDMLPVCPESHEQLHHAKHAAPARYVQRG